MKEISIVQTFFVIHPDLSVKPATEKYVDFPVHTVLRDKVLVFRIDPERKVIWGKSTNAVGMNDFLRH